MKICVLYNNPGTSTSEHIAESDDDTFESADAVGMVLKKLGYTSSLLGISVGDIDRIRDLECDLVFNLIEWSGRDVGYALQVLDTLEKMGAKYTGCKTWGYKVSTDKVLMKAEFGKHNIPTPKYEVIKKLNFERPNLNWPVIVKPAMEHSAIGIDQGSVVSNYAQLSNKCEELLKKFAQPVIVEEFIDGMEVHVTVIEREGKPWVLPPAAFDYKKKDGYFGIMSYEAKWNSKSWEADMTEWVDISNPLLVEKIIQVSEETFKKLGGRTHSRIDIRLRGDQVYVLEINNNPGIGWDEDSGMTYACKKVGLDYKDFIDLLVKSV